MKEVQDIGNSTAPKSPLPSRAKPQTSGRRTLGVGVGGGEVATAGGGGPAHDSRLGLVEERALGLVAAMVVAAERGQVALAGQAALVVGLGVVEVAAGGRSLAAGRAAGGGAGPDQVVEGAARGGGPRLWGARG